MLSIESYQTTLKTAIHSFLLNLFIIEVIVEEQVSKLCSWSRCITRCLHHG